MRKVYDSLHGISDKAISLSNAVEIMAYCLVDGKVEQESSFEMNLYNDLVAQLRKMKAGYSKTFSVHECFSVYSLNMCSETIKVSSKKNFGINLALSTDNWCTSRTTVIGKESLVIQSN